MPGPSGNRLDDGMSTIILFSSDGSIALYEKEVTPPGADGGEAVMTETMRNVKYVTRNPRELQDSNAATIKVAYDEGHLDRIRSMTNRRQQITFIYPTGRPDKFWAYLQRFVPDALVEGQQATATVTIMPTNQDLSGAETGPILGAAVELHIATFASPNGATAVTVTTTLPHGLSGGELVRISGVGGGYDGVHTVAAGASGSTYTMVGVVGPVSASGGTYSVVTPTSVFYSPGSFTFDCTGKTITAIRVWGPGAGGSTGGGGGGGFCSGKPTDSPASLAVTVFAGGAIGVNVPPAVMSKVEWDGGASYLHAGTGKCGDPGNDGSGGTGTSAGAVSGVVTHTGGLGDTGGHGGGGAGGGGDGSGGVTVFPDVPGAGGPPDGGAGGAADTPVAAPGGGGGGGSSGGAGGDGRVQIMYY